MQFTVAHDHPSLPGHFPGRPVVPGVVVLERVLAAIESAHGPQPGLRLPQVKFARPLLPGQQARIGLETKAPGRWRFRVTHEGELVATGEVAAQTA